MALKKLIEEGNGYGQLELNLVSFPRTGNIVAQYKAGTSFTENGIKYLENGMLLKVDGKNRCVDMKAPEDIGDIYALNYSTEHMYDERTYRLADFKLNPINDFYPRLGYLSVGDKFTTNCVCMEVQNGSELSGMTVAQLWEAISKSAVSNTLYGVPSAIGYIELKGEFSNYGPVLRAIEITTMPDGQNAIKFEVIRA